jgi:MerR family transcriptional regulator, light-induced transcriptional regulator
MAQSSRSMVRIPSQASTGRLYTSADAARVFRVGVSSIKRWTDDGELESVRTPGGHRRYTAAALHRFASIRGLPTDRLPEAASEDSPFEVQPPADITLFDALLHGNNDAVRKLVTPRVSSLSQRAAFLDRVIGDALREIGYRWEGGELSVDQEHLASNMITDSIERLRPSVTPRGPAVLLACPPNEWHELPLRMVRLMFEWCSWRTEFLGADVPWNALRTAVERSRPRVLAMSARESARFEFREFDALVEHCSNVGTQVIVGGEWARGGTGAVDGYMRFRTLRGFERWLRHMSHD